MENGIKRRRHRRISVRLQARYMLPDQREFACLVVDVAERRVALTGTPEGKIGEKVIVYIDRLGRIEGSIARVFEGGFAVEVAGSALALRNSLSGCGCSKATTIPRPPIAERTSASTPTTFPLG